VILVDGGWMRRQKLLIRIIYCNCSALQMLKPKLSDFLLDLHRSLAISAGLHQDPDTSLRKKSLNLG
jgi:hypothetical protein